ncbi:MAG: Type I restriction-modification system, S subunit [Candidatus Gottesmanbacteria bacterium GW2011_GWC2_39_8]|uniref:Type I restriction-modification system, S subunit n=1 Tax=Candidatus Gottesmanbacteria bacterium GW2011_GWC2_39_8 TaxID=1618450 RepID=A0A0G0S6A5_9BACT|nr:MAG: Type I restriction-modification system, S subunit [Candidatus Gottesmanbacteria bacterium GW2011_GWC2_39_8]
MTFNDLREFLNHLESKNILKRVKAQVDANVEIAGIMDRLAQPTLAKAFRGELVPQDPNDEPVSVSLEKIKAERVKIEANRKRRKTKRTQQ